jgi:Tfp pilus assembly protein PilO
VTLSFDLKDPRSQKMALAGMALIFLAYLWYSHIYTPGAEKIKGKKGEYEAMVSELVAVKAKAAPLESVREEQQRLTADLQPLEKLLPEKEYVVQFLKLLHHAAQLSDVLITELTPVGSTPQGAFIANDFRMGLEGNYHDFGRFLARVANFPFIVRVSQVNLRSYVRSRAEEGSTDKTVVASFIITTYNSNPETGGEVK